MKNRRYEIAILEVLLHLLDGDDAARREAFKDALDARGALVGDRWVDRGAGREVMIDLTDRLVGDLVELLESSDWAPDLKRAFADHVRKLARNWRDQIDTRFPPPLSAQVLPFQTTNGDAT
jgi:hypothetical protein